MGNLITFVRNKSEYDTLKGKINILIWFLLSVFFIIHFIFTCITLGDQDKDTFRVWMKYEEVELFPQIAICPETFVERDAKFTSGPTCWTQNRNTRTKTFISVSPETWTSPDGKFSMSCPVLNTKGDVYIGNNSLHCEWQVTSASTHHFVDAYVMYTQAADPRWIGCMDVQCPMGPNYARVPAHTFTWIGIEAVSFADDDDGGYKKIKAGSFQAGDLNTHLRLPQRSYRIFPRSFWNERERSNTTEFMTEWQSQDLLIYQPYQFFTFWGFCSYIGGAGFTMVMLHALFFGLIKIFLFGDVGESETGTRGEFQKL